MVTSNKRLKEPLEPDLLSCTEMGVVRDGTISGLSPDNEECVVRHPGYPSSASQAVQPLGGAERILKEIERSVCISTFLLGKFRTELQSFKLNDDY